MVKPFHLLHRHNSQYFASQNGSPIKIEDWWPVTVRAKAKSNYLFHYRYKQGFNVVLLQIGFVLPTLSAIVLLKMHSNKEFKITF